MKDTTYYEDQLDHINANEEVRVQFRGLGDSHTKWMSINPESAQDIVNWLTDNFLKNQPHIQSEQLFDDFTNEL